MAFDMGGVMSVMVTGLIILVILAAIGAIIFFVIMVSKFNIKVRIRSVIKGRKILSDTKGRLWKDPFGVSWLKIMKPKIKIPIPPPQSIEITNKGKMLVEFWKVEADQLIPITDNFDYENYKDDLSIGFEPLTTEDRALLVNEYIKSESYKKKRLSDLLMQAFPYIAVVMIITVFLLFFGEAVAPMERVGSQLASASESLQDASLSLENAILQKQVIGSIVHEPANPPPPE